MKTTGSRDLSCGGFSYNIIQADAKITCRNHPLQAPRGAKEAQGGPSLDSAIQQFCHDNNGKVIRKDWETKYQRYGITEYGVRDRSSFWLRGAKTCGDQVKMDKDDCIHALTSGMTKCDETNGYTHGLTAAYGCIDYSIDLSGTTFDDSPPWFDIQKVRFPPPEHVAKPGGGENFVKCFNGQRGRVLSDSDLNSAIDAFCQNGAEIKGIGSNNAQQYSYMTDYPPKGTPQFYQHEQLTMHLTMGAVLSGVEVPRENEKNLDNWKPYEDTRWCK